jgi:hypothetical protein
LGRKEDSNVLDETQTYSNQSPSLGWNSELDGTELDGNGTYPNHFPCLGRKEDFTGLDGTGTYSIHFTF